MKFVRLSFFATLLFALSLSMSLNSEAQAQEAASIDFEKPVVLVHGIGGAGYNFFSIERHLRDAGYDRADLHSIDFDDRSGNNLRNSRQLRDFIDDVLSQYEVDEVNIIAHSMGGSNTLRYLTQLDGVGNVDKVITLGGANRLGASSVPAGVDFTSIYSSSDLIVANSLSRITGANNIHVTGVTHLGLLTNNRVQSLIIEALEN
ncbi:esterase/lipase family protein [Alkalicoccobacillus porphyridii]|uniref:Alpha/beta fold hydrolase n=1 Tax=Alkalicoccobacillus porphyridii TaxID=2597270 RepID=A0A554A211_9BACI|nr:alpha/beta fold hydrolase [Alkalicoccobacillus porphyridii]TSB47729.1 alpha/beta fold hydrolase [Alkalicoccobacillus porphyridii]